MAVRGPRNVRPQLADYDDSVELDESDRDVAREDEHEIENESGNLSGEDEGSEEDNGSDPENYEEKVKHVSFGALKQAQDALSRKRKRGSDTTAEQEGKLEALRERLRHIKEANTQARSAKADQSMRSTKKPLNKPPREEDIDEAASASDSDSAPSEEDAAGRARTSKHAPTAMSSKRQVTRRRIVVDVPKRVIRDPRFDAISQNHVHPGNSDKAYSFLRDYQKSEISELKAALKKAKSEDDKEILKRKIGSMENRIRAKEAKEREQSIISQHRKEEREKIEQGKTPYYLKKKDIKEKALVEKFKGMKSKDREKLMERRKKKEGQKEKKRMPDARRFAG